MSNGVEFSFGQFGSAVPAVLPLSLLLPGARGRARSRRGLDTLHIVLNKHTAVLSALL